MYVVLGASGYIGSKFCNDLHSSRCEVVDVSRQEIDYTNGLVLTAWLDTGSHDNLASATDFVKVIERRQGLKIACLEEIAFHKGWMKHEDLVRSAQEHGSSSYGLYLRALLERL